MRYEIEHRSTSRIDVAVSAKLQACCINFNKTIKKLFGPQFDLERRLPIALQFVTFSSDQRAVLERASNLPRHIETMMDASHQRLTDEEQDDPHFVYRVAFVPKAANKAAAADLAVEFVKPGSDEAVEISRVLLKEVEKKKYRRGNIVQIMKDEGLKKFNVQRHTELWQSLGTHDEKKGYGATLFAGDWGWYESWLNRVREHCLEHEGSHR